jgi:hypothetical protein
MKDEFSPTTSIVLKHLYGQTCICTEFCLFSIITSNISSSYLSALRNLYLYAADHLVVIEILHQVTHLHRAGAQAITPTWSLMQLLMKLHCLEI